MKEIDNGRAAPSVEVAKNLQASDEFFSVKGIGSLKEAPVHLPDAPIPESYGASRSGRVVSSLSLQFSFVKLLFVCFLQQSAYP